MRFERQSGMTRRSAGRTVLPPRRERESMQFDDQQVDAGQLDDRRGMSAGAKLGAGAGGDRRRGHRAGGAGREPARGQRCAARRTCWTRCSAAAPASAVPAVARRATSSDAATRRGRIDRYEDCYVLKIFNEVNEVWAAALPQLRRDVHEPAAGVLPAGGADRRLRHGGSRPGRSTALPDQRVYIDLGFLDQLLSRSSARRAAATPQAYVARARGTATTCRTCSGSSRAVRRSSRRDPRPANALLGAAGAAGRLLRRRVGEHAGRPARATLADHRGRDRPGADRGRGRRRRPDPGELRSGRVDPRVVRPTARGASASSGSTTGSPERRPDAACDRSAHVDARYAGAQTLKPRARSCSRPSSVILSGPHGGIQTQLIRKSRRPRRSERSAGSGPR